VTVRRLLLIVTVTLFVIAGLRALDGDYPLAAVLFACAVVTGIARERF
jgi:hypothetical protein